jgi:ATP-binding protein involved in chromosome partitioning
LVAENAVVKVNFTADVTSGRLGNTPVLPQVRNVIAIASGKGGVGKSTVTANLAVALAQSGAKVGLIDADIFGPSMPVMFDCEDEKPELKAVDGRNMLIPIERYGVKIMSIGFLTPADSAVVWRGPMASTALRQFFTDCLWGELDYLLIDLPPGTSDIHLTMVQTVPVTGVVLVTTPQKVALADAQKGLQMFLQPQINVPIIGLIENMSYFTPAELPNNKYYIFGRDGGKGLAEQHSIDFLGEIPLVQSIREGGDEGRPVSLYDNENTNAFDTIAQMVAQRIAIMNASGIKAKKVDIKV